MVAVVAMVAILTVAVTMEAILIAAVAMVAMQADLISNKATSGKIALTSHLSQSKKITVSGRTPIAYQLRLSSKLWFKTLKMSGSLHLCNQIALLAKSLPCNGRKSRQYRQSELAESNSATLILLSRISRLSFTNTVEAENLLTLQPSSSMVATRVDLDYIEVHIQQPQSASKLFNTATLTDSDLRAPHIAMAILAQDLVVDMDEAGAMVAMAIAMEADMVATVDMEDMEDIAEIADMVQVADSVVALDTETTELGHQQAILASICHGLDRHFLTST